MPVEPGGDKGESYISIIVPAINEGETINTLVEHVHSLPFDGNIELIIVDGDPEGSTISGIKDPDVVTMTTPKGRALQMNAGASRARGRLLLFLHADTRLPDSALKHVHAIMEDGRFVAGCLDTDIDSTNPLVRLNARLGSLRARLTRVPYGDQAFFMERDYFQRIGGFADIPLMEDVELMGRIRRRGEPIVILPDRAVTSARRWEEEGLIYTSLRNSVLLALFHLGVSPTTLARYYPDPGHGGGCG
ncbi:MAG: TIGR04283 family arsenosugar biosynthesis glycosyltransferase [Candidatus Undinarchaeales archaeon]|jgi:rSAM/selenodomain-associated transferase 2|nr:TIGR04283 family arsenosugar biosynthesis glycosyltransferase [Candidatus Undinarchaeales archaeon]MDP7491328.1 TIGR04283 family arsenosugar biosynthesis glycosyltransferase [Candidatus Undinarchaeales archaeon]